MIIRYHYLLINIAPIISRSILYIRKIYYTIIYRLYYFPSHGVHTPITSHPKGKILISPARLKPPAFLLGISHERRRLKLKAELPPFRKIWWRCCAHEGRIDPPPVIRGLWFKVKCMIIHAWWENCFCLRGF